MNIPLGVTAIGEPMY